MESNHRTDARTLRIAGIQTAFQGSRQETVSRVSYLAGAALDKGAKLLVLPECYSIPWFHSMTRQSFTAMAEPIPGPSTLPLMRLTDNTQSACICPVYEEFNRRCYFSAAIVQAGNVIGVYRKVHPARTENWNEADLAEAGEILPVFDLGFIRIGILMGWDAFFPEAARSLALRGADLLVVPSAAAMASKFRWLSVLTSHAVCNNVFVIRVNRCGTENGLEFYGESFCIDPFGALLDEPTFHRDSLMIADIDPSEIEIARKEFPFLNERRPEVYDKVSAAFREETGEE